MSSDDFKRSLKKSANESIKYMKTPRRSIMNTTQNINEAGYFKSIDKMKAQALSDEIPVKTPVAEVPVDGAEVPAAPVKKKKKYDPLRRRAEVIKALRAGGSLEEFKDNILHWIKNHTNIDPTNYTGWSTKIYDVEITDELYININNEKDLVITGNDLGSAESYIWFNNISGNLTVGGNRYLTELPSCLQSATVQKDFHIINMPNLKSLMGAPLKVKGNYVVTGCKNLESLDGAPTKLDDFNGYFLSDTKFTNDDFYETIENGGLMKNSEYEAVSTSVEEALKTRKGIERLVESRITLGQKFNGKLNEAFSSRILSRLAKNPKNREALDRMKQMDIFWSEIPDEIIRPIYCDPIDSGSKNNKTIHKALAERRVDNGDTSSYGLVICCDVNDNITAIITGNAKGEWKNETWLYFSNDVLRAMNDRAVLVNKVNDPRSSAEEKEEASLELRKYGVYNAEKQALAAQCSAKVYGRSGRITPDNMTFELFHLVPDFMRKVYLIEGMDDKISAASQAPEYIRNFSYRSQGTRRKELAVNRREAIAGTLVNPRTRTIDATDDEGNVVKKVVPYSIHSRENDPAFKKYFDDFVDEEIIKKARTAHGSNVAFAEALKKMLESVNYAKRAVRTELFKCINDETIPEETFDVIYTRFVLSVYDKFKERIETAISNANTRANNSKSYIGRLSGNAGEPLDMKDIRHHEWERSRKLSDIIKKPYNVYGSPYSDENWYSLYVKILKTYAQIMAKVNSAKRGHPEELAAYAERVKKNFSVKDDEFITF